MGIINFTNQNTETMAEMDADVKAQIEAAAEQAYGTWKANVTEAQKAAGLEQLAKFTSDENYKNTKMAEMTAKFNECDVNGDGVLDRDEYLAWGNVMNDIAEAEGNYVDRSPELASAYYASCNMLTPGTDGLSMQDVMVGMGVAMAKTMALKAAD